MKETIYVPPIAALCINTGRVYWLCPKSSQGKPVNKFALANSKTTQKLAKAKIANILFAKLLAKRSDKKYFDKAKNGI